MTTLSDDIAFFRAVASRGGPRPDEDAELTSVIDRLWQAAQGSPSPSDVLNPVRAIMGFTPETMQGFAFLKPNGYPGCYEIIDRIYRRYHAADPALFNWDRYWQRHPAAQAVRNRKAYFADVILDAVGRCGEVTVLNVASGPCRDVLELFEGCPRLPVNVHCVEQDIRAIDYAQALCQHHLERIEFVQRNAFRMKLPRKYDLIWSAGLFDYLPPIPFVRLLRKLASAIRPGGELVVGNFAASNPSRAYMELIGWSLHHRSSSELLNLAEQAGLSMAKLEVRSDPTGVNLFLHVREDSV